MSMWFLSRFFAPLLLALCLMSAPGQTVNSAPRGNAVKESKIWEGKLADGTLLTQTRLGELLAAHRQWLQTADKKLNEEREKIRQDPDTNPEAWVRMLLTSGWGKGEGRLVIEGAVLREADLHNAELKWAKIGGANLERASLEGTQLEGAELWDVDLRGAKFGGANLKRADLRRAKLDGLKLWGHSLSLEGADLSGANLHGVELRQANMKWASLDGTALERADLSGPNLEEATLRETNLTGANLIGVILKRAELWETNLRGAKLNSANLEETVLFGVALDKACLHYANLRRVRYEPEVGSLPDIYCASTARDLETIWFHSNGYGMEELRRAFRHAGFVQQEHQITCAIKRSQQAKAWREGQRVEALFSYVLFDLPVAYGLYPGRALRILVSLIPVFAFFYGLAIVKSFHNHGIYRLWPRERIEMAENGAELTEAAKLKRLELRGWRAVAYALHFSLVSAFHIGWRELNVGNWISRLQLDTYTLQATGWVRTVSGLQSLISVYLLAMWALTYFGRPFE